MGHGWRSKKIKASQEGGREGLAREVGLEGWARAVCSDAIYIPVPVIPCLKQLDGFEDGNQAGAMLHGPGRNVRVPISQYPLGGIESTGRCGLED